MLPEDLLFGALVDVYYNNRDFESNQILPLLLLWIYSGNFRWENPDERSNVIREILTFKLEEDKKRKEVNNVNDTPNKYEFRVPVKHARFVDMRPYAMTMSGIKTFPYVTIKGENTVSGVLFYEDRYRNSKGINKEFIPASSIFLGTNGSGKTSLYVALELIGMGYSRIGESRNFKTEAEQQNTNIHFHSDRKQIGKTLSIKLYTKDGVKSFGYKNNLKKGIGLPPAFFCSEYDVIKLENQTIDAQYLCNQLGLGTMYTLFSFLISLKDMIERAGTITTYESQEDKSIFGEQKEAKENEIKKHRQYLANLEISDDMLAELKSISADVNQLIDYIRGIINDKLRQFHTVGKPIITKLLDDHKTLENEIFEVLLSESTNVGSHGLMDFDIRIKLNEISDESDNPENNKTEVMEEDIDRSADEEIVQSSESTLQGEDEKNITRNPREYFNTYRFKLYVFCVKVSLAIAAAKIHKIKFPIIIDDIFDGSDYENRNNIVYDVTNLLSIYNELQYNELKCQESENSDVVDFDPLQFIMFTQDEMISEGFYEALLNEYGPSGAKISRLHRPEEIVDDDEFTPLQSELPKGVKMYLVETPSA